MTIVDLVALARETLVEVDRKRPPDMHIVHRERTIQTAYALMDKDPGVYFNEIMEAAEVAVGPCLCSRCVTGRITADTSDVDPETR